MNLTDEELDALADRLASTRPHKWDWKDIAREAARWAAEKERERLEPLRVAVEGFKNLHANAYPVRALCDIANAARTLLEQTE